jgi:hypothetical protein
MTDTTMHRTSTATADRMSRTAAPAAPIVPAVERDDLLALARPSDEIWVTLLMSTRAGDRNHAEITLRNLIRSASTTMREADVPEATIAAVVRQLSQTDGEPDRHRSDGLGLALFATEDRKMVIRVPGTLPDVATVGNRGFVGPLVSAVLGCRHTVILALNGEEVQLFHLTPAGIDELPIEGSPIAPFATMPRQRRQLHAFVAGSGNSAHAVFSGSGTEADVGEKSALRRYFRQVDDAVQEMVGSEQSLLILAGVEETMALYREVSTYPYLLSDGISGAVRGMTLRELHDHAWRICEAAVRRSAAGPLARLRALLGTGRTMDEPAHVAAAAQAGRIDSLLLSNDPGVWTPADGRRALDLGGSGFPVNLDTAAVGTLQHGGSLYAVPQRELPSRSPVAAILRY